MNDYDPQRDARIEGLVTRVKSMFQGGRVDPDQARELLVELQSLVSNPGAAVAGIEPEHLAAILNGLRAEYYASPGLEVSPANSGRDCCWCSHYEDADDPGQFRCVFDDKVHPVANATRAQRCIHWLYPFGDIEA